MCIFICVFVKFFCRKFRVRVQSVCDGMNAIHKYRPLGLQESERLIHDPLVVEERIVRANEHTTRAWSRSVATQVTVTVMFDREVAIRRIVTPPRAA